MADWTHKRLLEKLDRVGAQRDMLLAAADLFVKSVAEEAGVQEHMMADELRASISEEGRTEIEKRTLQMLVNLQAVVEELKSDGGKQQ